MVIADYLNFPQPTLLSLTHFGECTRAKLLNKRSQSRFNPTLPHNLLRPALQLLQQPPIDMDKPTTMLEQAVC